jgi:hypothetical protein
LEPRIVWVPHHAPPFRRDDTAATICDRDGVLFRGTAAGGLNDSRRNRSCSLNGIRTAPRIRTTPSRLDEISLLTVLELTPQRFAIVGMSSHGCEAKEVVKRRPRLVGQFQEVDRSIFREGCREPSQQQSTYRHLVEFSLSRE